MNEQIVVERKEDGSLTMTTTVVNNLTDINIYQQIESLEVEKQRLITQSQELLARYNNANRKIAELQKVLESKPGFIDLSEVEEENILP